MRLAFRALALSAVVSGCGPTEDLSTTSAIDHHRVHASFMTFSNGDDIVEIDVGIGPSPTGCQILDPRISDGTTRWSPMQLYWVIFERASDATLGRQIRDTFFPGDLVDAREFARSHGFQMIRTQVADQIPISDLTLSSDRSRLDGVLGGLFDAKFRIVTRVEGDRCATQAYYCRTNRPDACQADGDYAILTSIHVTQNIFGYPTRVTYR